MDRELHIPRSWTYDPDRCRAAELGGDTVSAGRGAKGQRFYDWAVINLAEAAPGRHQLLIRRKRSTG